MYHYNSRCHKQGSFHAHKFSSPLLRPRPINIQPKSLSTGSVCKPTNSQPTSLSTGSVCKPTINQNHLAPALYVNPQTINQHHLALYANLQSTNITYHWLYKYNLQSPNITWPFVCITTDKHSTITGLVCITNYHIQLTSVNSGKHFCCWLCTCYNSHPTWGGGGGGGGGEIL